MPCYEFRFFSAECDRCSRPFLLSEDIDNAQRDGDEEEYGEGDVADEWGSVHEMVELGHTEDAEQQAEKVERDVPKGLNEEEIDEKLYDFIICFEPSHVNTT